jgi:hypothetical protein
MPLNQRVRGSSPGAPTKSFKHLAGSRSQQNRRRLHYRLQFCSRFELQHRRLGKLNVAAEIVRIPRRPRILRTDPGCTSEQVTLMDRYVCTLWKDALPIAGLLNKSQGRLRFPALRCALRNSDRRARLKADFAPFCFGTEMAGRLLRDASRITEPSFAVAGGANGRGAGRCIGAICPQMSVGISWAIASRVLISSSLPVYFGQSTTVLAFVITRCHIWNG